MVDEMRDATEFIETELIDCHSNIYASLISQTYQYSQIMA